MYDDFRTPMTDILLNRLIGDLGAERVAPRKEACIKLTQYTEKKVVDRLIAELQNKDPNIRGNAALVLGRMGNREAEKHLIPLLEDENPDVRMSACNALGSVGGMAVCDILIKFVGDDLIGEHAREAIERIRERGNREKAKNGPGKMTLADLSREQIIMEREEFIKKADELMGRINRIRNDQPEPQTKKPERRHRY